MSFINSFGQQIVENIIKTRYPCLLMISTIKKRARREEYYLITKTLLSMKSLIMCQESEIEEWRLWNSINN